MPSGLDAQYDFFLSHRDSVSTVPSEVADVLIKAIGPT
jgi:hypothetical protein